MRKGAGLFFKGYKIITIRVSKIKDQYICRQMWGIIVYIIGQEDIIKVNVHVFSGISIKKIYRSLCVKSKRYATQQKKQNRTRRYKEK